MMGVQFNVPFPPRVKFVSREAPAKRLAAYAYDLA
jgi:hypothetical protein